MVAYFDFFSRLVVTPYPANFHWSYFILFPQIPDGYIAKCFRHVDDLMKKFGNESNLPRQVLYSSLILFVSLS